jgi:hypothetical protein
MKYIIILLTSLFLVSTASADVKFKSIKDICIYYQEAILKNRNEFYEHVTRIQDKLYKQYEKKALENAKLYHYLDCREELGR